jgi:hypothetical protein
VIKPEIAAVKFCFYSKRFWQYFWLLVIGNIFCGFFAYSYKIYGEDKTSHKPISDTLLTWAASIGSGLVNGSSRLIMGSLQDKFKFKTLLGVLYLIWTVLAASVYWLVDYPALYFIAILLNYFATGGIFAIFPGSVTNCFGITKAP